MKTVIEMAQEAGASKVVSPRNPDRPAHSFSMTHLERFAALVRAEEHKRFCAYLRQMHDAYALSSYPEGMKLRGETK